MVLIFGHCNPFLLLSCSEVCRETPANVQDSPRRRVPKVLHAASSSLSSSSEADSSALATPDQVPSVSETAQATSLGFGHAVNEVGRHRNTEGLHSEHKLMHPMSGSTFSIPQYSFQATTPSPTGTLSLGYWFRTVGAVSNISLVLIDDSEFSNFQSGAAFTYYVFWSRINTNLVWFPTQTMSSVAAPRRFIVYGVNFAATTVVGGSNLINNVCVPSSTCVNGGICKTGHTCDCPPQWSGADCSTPVCSAVTCNSHQTCSAPDVCTCQTGWSGSTCNVPTCTPACVAGQGTCTSPNTCTCAAGFSGSSCSGVDGGYSSFGALGSCHYDMLTGTCQSTQSRTCTVPAPSNGGRDCTALGSSSQSSACVCPPIDGGYTDWASSNPGLGCAASQASSSGCAIAQQRTCTNPAPRFGGRDCSSLGAAQRSLPCACTPVGVDGNVGSASSASSSFALPTQCNNLVTIAVDEVTGSCTLDAQEAVCWRSGVPHPVRWCFQLASAMGGLLSPSLSPEIAAF